MNVVAIILAIVVILLFYILYRYFTVSATELTSTASLLETSPSITLVNNPTSTRYTYGIWIYVNSWDTSAEKTIFKRNNNIHLYFDRSSPTLKCEMSMSNSGAPVIMEITDNFPLQKWVHIVTSIDNQYLDAYLDGKLIRSARIYTQPEAAVEADQANGVQAIPAIPESMPVQPGMDTVNIGSGYDAYISNFNHWASPLDPQTVWSVYKEGNGQSNMKNFMSSYGVDLSITSNGGSTKYQII